MSEFRKEDVGLSDIVRGSAEQFGRGVQEVGQNFRSFTEDVGRNVRGFAEDTGRNISEVVKPGLESVDKAAGQAVIGAGEKVQELATMSPQEHAAALGGNAEKVGASMLGGARAVTEGVGNTVGKGVHEVGNFFSDVGRNLESAKANVLGGVGDFFKGQAESAQDRADSLDAGRKDYEPFSFDDGAAKAGALGAPAADEASRGSISEMHRQDTAELSKRIGKDVEGPEVG